MSQGAAQVIALKFFSANEDLSTRAYLQISANECKVVRQMDGEIDIWKEYKGVGSVP